MVRLPVVRPGVSSSVAVGGSRAYCRWQLGLPVMSGCAIEECERKHLARGWCHVHYSRWRKHGDPMKTLIRTKDDVQKRDANGNKLCWKCSQWQQESEFYLQSRFSDGLDKIARLVLVRRHARPSTALMSSRYWKPSRVSAPYATKGLAYQPWLLTTITPVAQVRGVAEIVSGDSCARNATLA